MDTTFKTILAVIFGIGVYVVVSIIPVLNIVALPMAILSGIGAGTYLMSGMN